MSKYDELRKTYETERDTWTADKKTLEDTIVDLSTSEKHSENDRTSRETEVRQQEERAKVVFRAFIRCTRFLPLAFQAAEARYSNEVVAHAESIKIIESLKKELHAAQAAARDNETATETARANLAASESSWKQQKEALDKEIDNLNSR